MALIFSDGFDSYSAASDFTNRWTVASSANFSATGGRWGGGAFQATFGGYLSKTLPTPLVAGNTLATGFWFSSGAGTQSGSMRFDTSGSGGTNNLFFSTNAAGRPVLNQFGSSSTALITGTSSICDGQWHWVELFVTFQTGATGAAGIWVDGISQGSVSSTQTVANTNYLPVIALQYVNSSSSNTFFDDIHTWDYSGSFFNTSPMGPLRVKTLVPTGDSTPLQFTPDTGTTHFSQITGGYSNTHYVQDGGTGNVDMYTYGSLGFTPTSVYAVVANYWAQNPGSGTSNLIPQLKTGATTVQGTTGTLATGGVNKLVSQTWYQDATSTNWTATTVNSMIIGVGD